MSRNHRVGYWYPVILVEMVPSVAVGDTPGIDRCRPLSPSRFLRVKTGLVLAAQVSGMCAHVTPECAPTLNRNPCPDASGICIQVDLHTVSPVSPQTG